MLTRDELVQALVQLDPATLEDVVNSAYRGRGHDEPSDQPDLEERATPARFARWLALRHLSTDGALERVIYLPSGAPENEIRLLEINRLLGPSDTDAIEPLDFTLEMDLPYRVFVADITSDQWDRVRRDPGPLPPGWDLHDYAVIIRG